MLGIKYKAMRGGMRKSGAPRFAIALAFVYVFFLLFPHFDAVTHRHSGGGNNHHHAFLSAHDVALERAALAAVPQGAPNAEIDPEEASRSESPSASSSTSSPVGADGKSLTAEKRSAHTHFQEDPNLPVLAVDPVTDENVLTVLPAPETVPAFVPALAAQASPARAPPGA
jgi:hypothetical protein